MPPSRRFQLLAKGVIQSSQAPDSGTRRDLLTAFRDLELNDQETVREIAELTARELKILAGFGNDPFPKGYMGEKWEKLRRAYYARHPAGVHPLTISVAGKLRELFTKLNPSDVNRLSAMREKRPAAALGMMVMRAALLQEGQETSQDDLRSVFKLDIQATPSEKIISAVEPLLQAWTFELRNPYVRIASIPSVYPLDLVTKVKENLRKYSPTESDVHFLAAVIPATGGTRDDVYALFSLLGQLESEIEDEREQARKNNGHASPLPAVAPMRARKDTAQPATPPPPRADRPVGEKEKAPLPQISPAIVDAYRQVASLCGMKDNEVPNYVRYALQDAQALARDDHPVMADLRLLLHTTAAIDESILVQEPSDASIRTFQNVLSRMVIGLHATLERSQSYWMPHKLKTTDKKFQTSIPQQVGYLHAIHTLLHNAIERAAPGCDEKLREIILSVCDEALFGILFSYVHLHYQASRINPTTKGSSRPKASPEWAGFCSQWKKISEGLNGSNDPLARQYGKFLVLTDLTLMRLLWDGQKNQKTTEGSEDTLRAIPAHCPPCLHAHIRVRNQEVDGSFSSYLPTFLQKIQHVQGRTQDSPNLLTQKNLGSPPSLASACIPLEDMVGDGSPAVGEAHRRMSLARDNLGVTLASARAANIPLAHSAFREGLPLAYVDVQILPQAEPVRGFVFEAQVAGMLGVSGQELPQDILSCLEKCKVIVARPGTTFLFVPALPMSQEKEATTKLSGAEINSAVREWMTQEFPWQVPLDKAERFMALAGISLEKGRPGHALWRDLWGKKRPLSTKESIEGVVPRQYMFNVLFNERGSLPALGNKQWIYDWLQEKPRTYSDI